MASTLSTQPSVWPFTTVDTKPVAFDYSRVLAVIPGSALSSPSATLINQATGANQSTSITAGPVISGSSVTLTISALPVGTYILSVTVTVAAGHTETRDLEIDCLH